ncbi:MAG: acyl-CoA dehydrogenase, partial [Planctomycetes bacterium]|nr:acyl-CoA dehydrogenase [Planctomycetota bacterium]
AAKFCIERAVHHANTRVQFGETLGSFELVKEKLAFMQAGAFAMEACTYQTAALIDSGESDFMLETAMLKVFTTETLWRIINDTFQLYGGKAYFTDEPFERMMRDARINTIGEGANDVLRAFLAVIGMRDVGLQLQGVLKAIKHPIGNFGLLGRFTGRKLGGLLAPPEVPVRSPELEPDAARLAKSVSGFGRNVERLLRTYQTEIVDRQYHLARVADAAMDLYAAASVLRRLDAILRDHHLEESEQRFHLATGRYFLTLADRRIRRSLRDLWDNDDEATTLLANKILKRQ